MTRLIETDIKDIPSHLPAYDAELIVKTGCSLGQIACHAWGATEENIMRRLENMRVGVVPITSGLGRLHGFCEAVAAIADHIGCQAGVSQQTDVAGMVEAIESNVDIIMMADEQRFIALNMNTRKTADNSIATGRGFATALHHMTGSSLWGRSVLVLGCGPVGQNAVKTLLEYDCHVSVYDSNDQTYSSLLELCNPESHGFIRWVNDLETALYEHTFIVDATPAGAFIRKRHIKPDTMISAPGMPLGLDQAAQNAIGNRLIYDPLQIGVATMLVSALV